LKVGSGLNTVQKNISSQILTNGTLTTKTKKMKAERIRKMAEIYSRDTKTAFVVAEICDEILNRGTTR
jgi:hypothetical protein